MSCGSYSPSEHGHAYRHDYNERLDALRSMMHEYMHDQDDQEGQDQEGQDESQSTASPWFNMREEEDQVEDPQEDQDMGATISNFHDIYRSAEENSHSPYADRDWMHSEETGEAEEQTEDMSSSSMNLNRQVGDALNNLNTVELYHVWRNLNESDEQEETEESQY